MDETPHTLPASSVAFGGVAPHQGTTMGASAYPAARRTISVDEAAKILKVGRRVVGELMDLGRIAYRTKVPGRARPTYELFLDSVLAYHNAATWVGGRTSDRAAAARKVRPKPSRPRAPKHINLRGS